MRNQPLIGISLFVIGLWLAWEIGGKIVNDDMRSITFIALGVAGCAVAVTTLRNWRTGFYLFFVWMMFEDLARKYMGNNLALFFGKDILLAFVYVAFYLEVRRGREKRFRPPFLLALSLFFWLGVLQVFNPNSPHILYSLLGFKVLFLLCSPSVRGIRPGTHRQGLAKVLGGQCGPGRLDCHIGNFPSDLRQYIFKSSEIGSRVGGFRKPLQGQPVVRSNSFSSGLGICELGPFRGILDLGIYPRRWARPLISCCTRPAIGSLYLPWSAHWR